VNPSSCCFFAFTTVERVLAQIIVEIFEVLSDEINTQFFAHRVANLLHSYSRVEFGCINNKAGYNPIMEFDKGFYS